MTRPATRRAPRRRGSDDRGATAILVAVLAVVLVGIVAFATDLGLAYARSKQLQAASDAAALAAAKELLDAAPLGRSCANVLSAAQSQADSVARTYALRDAPPGSSLATGAAPTGWSGDAGVAFRCNPASVAEVRVSTTNPSPSFFGGIFGVNGYALAKAATAAMGPGTSFTGLRPFSFCKNLADAIVEADKISPGAAQLLTIDKVWNPKYPSGLGTTPCPGSDAASGNWGVLGLDGSSNDPKDVTLWTDVGYNAPIDLSAGYVTFPGNPGFPSANAGQCTTGDGCQHTVKTDGALNDILGQPSLFPVWDAMTGKGGNNADFRVVGVLAVKLCGWQLGNESGTTPDPDYGGEPCYDSTTAGVQLPGKKGGDAFQIRLERYIPIGELSDQCGLTGGTAACENNPRVTQLIE